MARSYPNWYILVVDDYNTEALPSSIGVWALLRLLSSFEAFLLCSIMAKNQRKHGPDVVTGTVQR